AQPFSIEARTLIVLIMAGLVGSIGLLVVWLAAVRSPPARVFWMGVPPLVGAIIALAATRFAHTCTYVGTEGVARFRCGGRRGRLVERTVFLFRAAAAVRSSLTHRYQKGQYQGSDY